MKYIVTIEDSKVTGVRMVGDKCELGANDREITEYDVNLLGLEYNSTQDAILNPDGSIAYQF